MTIPSASDLNEPVTIVPYDQQWSTLYSDEQKNLMRILAVKFSQIAHIGSTSVAGMAAKPIIDIMAGLADYSPDTCQHQGLIDSGYRHMGDAGIVERQYYIRRQPYAVNLHVVPPDGDHWYNNIAIRNYLRVHARARYQYSRLKQKIISNGNTSLLPYSAAKDSFITELKLDALEWQSNLQATNKDLPI